ncbi:MAG: insulinase family protein [Chitinispirillaceae bacterium]
MAKDRVPAQDIRPDAQIGGFQVERIQQIPELHSTAYLFSHLKTGARLIHLYNDDPNNLFSVAFRTPVSDSTGVPHILEHSVLCGSEKFPLKDPFQELLKGSLQTFLNALTYPDKTVYPVSSQVEKDYYNLVDVYCDAVFNPMLTENTFYQEGWHYDVENPSDPADIKGIVYNEMKGVFSDFSSHVARRTLSALFPDTTYYHESGGDPENITDLTYEQFRDFHRKFYHPSNSYIFLYGNLPSEKTLNFLNDNYLSEFGTLKIDSTIKPQPLWSEPRTMSIEAPAPKEDDGTATVLSMWVFGDSTDPVATFAGSILSHYLLGTESSPLKRALIDSGLGEDLDDMSGFDGELVQSIFAAGLRKTRPEHAEKINGIIQSTLEKQVKDGLDKELLEGALRQVEFHLREITGGHFPYGLKLADRCYRSWIHEGDPLALLAFESPLAHIKDKMKEGGFFEGFIRERLLDNRHRLLATIVASSAMGDKLEKQTVDQAKKLTEGFTQEDRKRYHELTQILIEQQKTPSSAEALATLPKLTKSDLPREGKKVPAEKGALGKVPFYKHPIFTSGIAYLDIGFDLRGIPTDLVMFLPIYLELLTRCGAGKYSYEQMAKRVSLSTGGIDSSVTCKTRVGTSDELFFMAFVHGKALTTRFGEMLDIFSDLFHNPDLSNRKQIRDILLEERNGLVSSVISAGHHFAMASAAARLSKSRLVDEMLGGVTQLRFLDARVKKEDYDFIIDSCKRLHEFIINRGTCVVSLTADNPSEFSGTLEAFMEKVPEKTRMTGDLSSPVSGAADYRGIEISSAVNFVARAWKLPEVNPVENGQMFLLSRNLSTGYLWDKIRVEGGAYGGMAGVSVSHPVFTCGSYRDPNLYQTLKHFEGGLQEVASVISEEKVDQSIVGAIGRIDSPRSPHGQGLGETMNILSGFTEQHRQEFRESVLGATPKSLGESARKILDSKDWAVSVLGSPAAFDKASQQGLKLEREPLIPSE